MLGADDGREGFLCGGVVCGKATFDFDVLVSWGWQGRPLCGGSLIVAAMMECLVISMTRMQNCHEVIEGYLKLSST
jgi:hypothetical protein